MGDYSRRLVSKAIGRGPQHIGCRDLDGTLRDPAVFRSRGRHVESIVDGIRRFIGQKRYRNRRFEKTALVGHTGFGGKAPETLRVGHAGCRLGHETQLDRFAFNNTGAAVRDIRELRREGRGVSVCYSYAVGVDEAEVFTVRADSKVSVQFPVRIPAVFSGRKDDEVTVRINDNRREAPLCEIVCTVAQVPTAQVNRIGAPVVNSSQSELSPSSSNPADWLLARNSDMVSCASDETTADSHARIRTAVSVARALADARYAEPSGWHRDIFELVPIHLKKRAKSQIIGGFSVSLPYVYKEKRICLNGFIFGSIRPKGWLGVVSQRFRVPRKAAHFKHPVRMWARRFHINN